jgi:DNA-binding MarR family transcriptional regulator
MAAARTDDRDFRRAIQVIQVAFPQIYLACHTRHQRKRSTPYRISPRDAAILAHLDEAVPIAPCILASHLGIARSTLSEALKRLASLGFVNGPAGAAEQSAPASDRLRRTNVRLSSRGADAIRNTSVLETARLETVLAGLSSAELRTVTAGMASLGAASRKQAEPARRERGTSR